ncbi:fibronectin type III domain-containing protein [Streptomyces roseicoloratus]|uniref:Fibronectin type III domain-containing protein n=1 Tax=Streptomyces roseicoloratus TaxID=2508722 RepID=A0ABY9RRD2_9ACTN|nr:fibronectin type III domain-containing protein [Streptomyces roseicoloratus]WMX44303.1 fibronectin type III domain-containing protein [Streptomyces roseicoloratus]
MQRPLTATLLTLTALAAAPLSACSGTAAAARDTRPPSVPAGVTATAGSATTVHVMWNAATDDKAVTGYTVHHQGRPVKELPAGTLMTDVTGLAPATPHTFTVRARDAAGNVSADSAAVTATTPAATAEDRTPPSRPTALRVTPTGPGAATLTWRPARDDTRVTAYDVYQSGTRVHTVPGSATEASLTTLRPATAYTFTVRARDAAENSSPDSDAADLTTPAAPGRRPATAPTGVTATAAKGTITVTWTPPRTATPVKEHQLHLNGRFATTIVWGADPGPGPVEYTLTVPATPGVRYALTLRARLPDGTWGDFSAPRTVVTV